MSVKSARTSKELVEAARACLSENNFAPVKAGELLTSAVQQDPTFVNALVLRSNLASRLGQVTAATADLSLAIEVDRGSSDARRVASLYGSRSSLLARAGRHADAIADLRAALKCEPDNGVWAFELGRAYLRDGRVSLAQLHFQQALQEGMWAHVGEGTRPKVYALYGRSCLMSRDYKKAKMLLRKSLEVGGEGAAVLHDVGLAHYYEGTAPTAALDFFARAAEMDAQPVEYPMHLGLTHIRCGNLNDALSAMNEAVLRGREAALLRFYRGCIELQLQLGPQALVDLQAAAEAHDEAKGDAISTTTAAAARRDDALSRSTDCALSSSAPAWLAMALVHLFCEKSLRMASTCLAEALRRDVDEQEGTLAGILLGIVLHQQGRPFEALGALSSVLAATSAAARQRQPHVHRLTSQESSVADDGSSNASGGGGTASGAFTDHFDADMELLVLTHVGLAYAACNYPDLALRFFARARQRAEQRGQPTLRLACLFREAVAQAQLHDNWGALQTLQSSASSPAAVRLGRGKADRGSPALPSPSVTLTNIDVSGVAAASTATNRSGGGGGRGPKRTHATPPPHGSRAPEGEDVVDPAAPHPPSTPPPASTILKLHVQSAGETSHLYAVTLRRLGRLSEALPYATAAVTACEREAAGAAAASTVDVPAYLYNRARIHFSLHNYTEAMADVQACIQACSPPNAATAAGELADPYYLQGCIAHATGAYAAALDSLTKALAMDDTLRTSPVFSYSHGVLLAMAGQHEAAVDAFTAAIRHSRGAVTAAEAVSEARGAGVLNCPAVYHHERAKVYQQMGRYAEALADYNAVLPKAVTAARTTLPAAEGSAQAQEAPGRLNWNALVNRALTLKELHRYEEAAMDWDAALRLDESGCLAQFTSQDVFEMPYLELCQPGCEMYRPDSM